MRSTLVFACLLMACSGSDPEAAPSTETDSGSVAADTTATETTPADDSAIVEETSSADTAKPDAPLDTPPLPGAERTFTFVNQCAFPVWVGALNNPEFTVPAKGGFALAAGESHAI
ncbi:MAG: hypothetical protein ACXVEE_35635, partial [Polyangiales bacterium]